MAHLHWRRRTQIPTLIKIPYPMATFSYAKHFTLNRLGSLLPISVLDSNPSPSPAMYMSHYIVICRTFTLHEVRFSQIQIPILTANYRNEIGILIRIAIRVWAIICHVRTRASLVVGGKKIECSWLLTESEGQTAPLHVVLSTSSAVGIHEHTELCANKIGPGSV